MAATFPSHIVNVSEEGEICPTQQVRHGDERFQQQHMNRKRPLHSESSLPLGPPRARWKHNPHSEPAPGNNGSDREMDGGIRRRGANQDRTKEEQYRQRWDSRRGGEYRANNDERFRRQSDNDRRDRTRERAASRGRWDHQQSPHGNARDERIESRGREQRYRRDERHRGVESPSSRYGSNEGRSYQSPDNRRWRQGRPAHEWNGRTRRWGNDGSSRSFSFDSSEERRGTLEHRSRSSSMHRGDAGFRQERHRNGTSQDHNNERVAPVDRLHATDEQPLHHRNDSGVHERMPRRRSSPLKKRWLPPPPTCQQPVSAGPSHPKPTPISEMTVLSTGGGQRPMKPMDVQNSCLGTAALNAPGGARNSNAAMKQKQLGVSSENNTDATKTEEESVVIKNTAADGDAKREHSALREAPGVAVETDHSPLGRIIELNSAAVSPDVTEASMEAGGCHRTMQTSSTEHRCLGSGNLTVPGEVHMSGDAVKRENDIASLGKGTKKSEIALENMGIENNSAETADKRGASTLSVAPSTADRDRNLLGTIAEKNKLDIAVTCDIAEASRKECPTEHNSPISEHATAPSARPQDVEPALVVSESPHSLIHMEEEATQRDGEGRNSTYPGINAQIADSGTDTTQYSTIKEKGEMDVSKSVSCEPQKDGSHFQRSNRSEDGSDSDSSSSSSEDEEEIGRWAQKMFGITLPSPAALAAPIASKEVQNEKNHRMSSLKLRITISKEKMAQAAATGPLFPAFESSSCSSSDEESSVSSTTSSDSEASSLWDHSVYVDTVAGKVKERSKNRRMNASQSKKAASSQSRKSTASRKKAPAKTASRKRNKSSAKAKAPTKKKQSNSRRKPAGAKTSMTAKEKRLEKERFERLEKERLVQLEKERVATEEARRVKKEAKPLTPAELKAILSEDDHLVAPSTHWVRRSVRHPCRSALNSPHVRSLLDKLRSNDSDVVVLKMKKYVSDPDAPAVVIDAVLDALEENTNCEALYIQNFNEGMRDEQVLHLLKVLQLPSCRIWCLNIGETYNVKTKTWRAFAKGLKKTKVTHTYASEHTISTALKDEIRDTIRNNRKKHDMHINPNNLDVIVQCTHCWWNPINAKVLRPYLRSRGYEHILFDKEAQGLRGSTGGEKAIGT